MKYKKGVRLIDRVAPKDERKLKPPKDVPSINELADKMIEWVYATDAYNIADFPLSLRISPYHFYRCSEVSEYFGTALTTAKYMIASRIKKGWREGRFSTDYANKELYQYDPEFKKDYMEVKYTQQKAMSDSYANARFVIEAPQIPSSDKVKQLEVKK